ncbi:MAG: hypothetical protein M3Q27_15205 [Actinomycetota bacterium]|nr:hypothetical protein [Actinomycetota bacterium]
MAAGAALLSLGVLIRILGFALGRDYARVAREAVVLALVAAIVLVVRGGLRDPSPPSGERDR